MPEDIIELPIQREAISRYIYNVGILICLLVIPFWCVGLVLLPIWVFWLGKSLPLRQADALRYWIEDSTLRVEEGVYFLRRKAIPLERITDIALVQGPLTRYFGLWLLQIQTSGMGTPVPEAALLGLCDPEKVRDLILSERNRRR